VQQQDVFAAFPDILVGQAPNVQQQTTEPISNRSVNIAISTFRPMTNLKTIPDRPNFSMPYRPNSSGRSRFPGTQTTHEPPKCHLSIQ